MIKAVGKIGFMYISGLFTAAGKVSLSKNILDAEDVSGYEEWLKENITGISIKHVKVTFEEVE